jgi:hypothetical protein
MATPLQAADRAASGATGADPTRGAPTWTADPRGERLALIAGALALTAGALALTALLAAVHTLRVGTRVRRGRAPRPVARVPDLRTRINGTATSR